MKWLVAAVESSIGWPTSEVEHVYLGRRFLLRPESKDFYADIVTEIGSVSDFPTAEGELLRFCSVLAWVKDGSVGIVSIQPTSAEMAPRVARRAKTIHGQFPTLSLIPVDANLQLMFALYREALAVNSALFAFFGYFKILNTKLTGDFQKEWINSNVTRLTDQAALERVKELKFDGRTDIGSHIYNDLRTAVIHASERHNVDPDNVSAVSMLSRDLLVMKALAELFIGDEICARTNAQP